MLCDPALQGKVRVTVLVDTLGKAVDGIGGLEGMGFERALADIGDAQDALGGAVILCER